MINPPYTKFDHSSHYGPTLLTRLPRRFTREERERTKARRTSRLAMLFA